jgi:hypothetical protein
MPEHANFLTLVLAHFRDTLEHNTSLLGRTIVGNEEPTWASFEPLAASLFVVCLILVFALASSSATAKRNRRQ